MNLETMLSAVRREPHFERGVLVRIEQERLQEGYVPHVQPRSAVEIAGGSARELKIGRARKEHLLAEGVLGQDPIRCPQPGLVNHSAVQSIAPCAQQRMAQL